MLVAALQDGDGAPDTIISTATLTITSLMEHWNQSIRGRCGRVDCSRLSYKYYNSSALLTHMGGLWRYSCQSRGRRCSTVWQVGGYQSQRQNNANAESFERKMLDAAVLGASFLAIFLAFVGVANPRYRISFIRSRAWTLEKRRAAATHGSRWRIDKCKVQWTVV